MQRRSESRSHKSCLYHEHTNPIRPARLTADLAVHGRDPIALFAQKQAPLTKSGQGASRSFVIGGLELVPEELVIDLVMVLNLGCLHARAE